MRSNFLGSAAIALCLGIASGNAQMNVDTHLPSVQRDGGTVSVIGRGGSLGAAREDAIKQALQLTMQQLIVVDKAITDNTVTRNKIMSTMNGYIDKFIQKDIKQTINGVELYADVTVSPSRILNYLGGGASGGRVQGESLFAEAARASAQQQARVEIFQHLLRGFPSSAITVKIDSIQPNAQYPETANIQATLEVNPDFFKSLEQGIAAISSTKSTFDKIDVLNARPGAIQGMISPYDASSFYNPLAQHFPDPTVCFGNNAIMRLETPNSCYHLPPAPYLAAFMDRIDSNLPLSEFQTLFFALRFLDSKGGALAINGADDSCIIVPGFSQYEAATESNNHNSVAFAFSPLLLTANLDPSTHDGQMRALFMFGVKVKLIIFMRMDLVNIREVSKIAIMPLLPSVNLPFGAAVTSERSVGAIMAKLKNTGRYYVDVTEPAMSRKELCGTPLDDIASKTMLSQ